MSRCVVHTGQPPYGSTATGRLELSAHTSFVIQSLPNGGVAAQISGATTQHDTTVAAATEILTNILPSSFFPATEVIGWPFFYINTHRCQKVLRVAVQDLDKAGGGIDVQHVAGAEELRHVAGEAIDQRHAAEGRILCDD